MTTRVIIQNPSENTKSVRVRTIDVGGAPADVTLEPGGSADTYVHQTRALEVSEVRDPDASSPSQRDHVEQFFEYSHLPPRLQSVSRPFCELAKLVIATLPRNPSRTIALNKLVEAKDAAVRARLAKD